MTLPLRRCICIGPLVTVPIISGELAMAAVIAVSILTGFGIMASVIAIPILTRLLILTLVIAVLIITGLLTAAMLGHVARTMGFAYDLPEVKIGIVRNFPPTLASLESRDHFSEAVARSIGQ